MKITRSQLISLIRTEASRLHEGDVIDLFPKGKPAPQDKDMLANALAARAEELLDLDGNGDDIEVRVEPSLFMQPYIDIDGHGKVVPSLVDHVYDNYIIGMAGDYAEKLDDIIERIGIDYFDESIEYVLKALGDDRYDGTQDQMMKTKDRASRQDQEEVADMDLDFDRYLQGIESGKVVELDQEEV
jgi:hypothetical protein